MQCNCISLLEEKVEQRFKSENKELVMWTNMYGQHHNGEKHLLRIPIRVFYGKCRWWSKIVKSNTKVYPVEIKFCPFCGKEV